MATNCFAMLPSVDNNRRLSLPARAWRYRAAVGGLVALVLAIVGEALQRTTPETAPANPQLGQAFMIAAVLLVGLVAWVRDDRPRLSLTRRKRTDETVASQPPIPIRRAGQHSVLAPLMARPVRPR